MSSKEDKDPGEIEGVEGRLRRLLSKVVVELSFVLCSLGFSLTGVQTNNLYLEKTCRVGSFFFGNGTTYSDEVHTRYGPELPILFVRSVPTCPTVPTPPSSRSADTAGKVLTCSSEQARMISFGQCALLRSDFFGPTDMMADRHKKHDMVLLHYIYLNPT